MRVWFFLIACLPLFAGGAETVAYWRMDGVNGRFDGSNAVKDGAPLKRVAGSEPESLSYRQAQCLMPAVETDRPLRRMGNRGSLYVQGGRTPLEYAAEGVGRFLDLVQSFTVEGWFRTSDEVTGEGPFFKVYGADCGWVFGLRRNDGRVTPYVRINRGGQAPVWIDFPEADCSRRMAWRAIALTFDPHREPGRWCVWLDGQVYPGVPSAAGNTALRECGRVAFGNIEEMGGFHGELDLWRISKGVVESSASLYACRTRTVAFWPLVRGTADPTGLANRMGDSRFALTVGADGGVSYSEGMNLGGIPNPDRSIPDDPRGWVRNGCFTFAGGIGVRSLLAADGLGSFCEWTRGFTVEGWFKKRGDPDDRRPWQIAGARDDTNGWSLFLGRNAEGAVCFSLYVNNVSSGGDLQFEKPFRQVDLSGDQEWHHVALVCDPSVDKAGAWILFLDGVWQGTVLNPSRADKRHQFPTLFLGGRPSYSNSFVGQLSGWRVSDGPLAADAFLCASPEQPSASRPDESPDPRDLRSAHVLTTGEYSKANPAVTMLSGDRFMTVTTEWNETTKPRVVSRLCRIDGGQAASPVTIDPNAAWATLYRTRFGRLYLFFLQPNDPSLPDSEQIEREASQQGWWAFRYSDDEGKSWSEKAYRIPMRLTDIDKRKPWRGEPFRFWSVATPVDVGMETVLAFTKIGSLTANEKEGWVVRTRQLQNERNPDLIKFEMFPEGDRGIRHPEFGMDQDRHQLVALDDTEVLCVFQTAGNPAQSLSRDGGVHWSLPERMEYGGAATRPIPCGHAAPRVFRTGADRFSMLFTNVSGEHPEQTDTLFLSTGTLDASKRIVWSEPELFCYGAALTALDWLDTADGGRIVAVDAANRLLVFPVPFGFGKGMPDSTALPKEATPETFAREMRGGVSVVLTVAGRETTEGGVLFSTMDGHRGMRIVRLVSRRNAPVLQIELFDGDRAVSWQADESALSLDGTQAIAFICDFRAGVLSVVSNGCFRDGGGLRPRGWGRIPRGFGSIAARHPKTAPAVRSVRFFNVPLTTAQAVRLTSP
ncbi:MAG: hypothetical protein J6336_05170 [Kiritimatiellae bacterium]|nr:hypothetical protein [Kiritimatiellia bacterium]